METTLMVSAMFTVLYGADNRNGNWSNDYT